MRGNFSLVWGRTKPGSVIPDVIPNWIAEPNQYLKAHLAVCPNYNPANPYWQTCPFINPLLSVEPNCPDGRYREY